MLWRYALVKVGARRDARQRYVLAEPGAGDSPADAARRLLHFYGPATADELQAWARVARSHARRTWQELEGELVDVRVDGRRGQLLAGDLDALESPRSVAGLRLLPPGDPYLQQPNRALLVPDPQQRKRVFRPVASPGVVLQDGDVAGLWRSRLRGPRLEVEVEQLARIDTDALAAEAERVAGLRGAREAQLTVRA
ncbi:MAG: winged helix DNA-binding domain-containing protein [Thermoleophilia bacterium]|nr:winged helix DNA-binding domain-containing protein [Thermoleophilia bacterium]